MIPGVSKSKKGWEASIGIAGTLAIVSACLRGGLLLVDWIGRVQTTIAISPYLGRLMSAPAFITELVVGFAFLYVALRLEHEREEEEAPRIIPAYTVPTPPKRRRLWLRIAVVIAIVLVLGGVGGGVWFRLRTKPITTAQITKVTPPRAASPAAPIIRPRLSKTTSAPKIDKNAVTPGSSPAGSSPTSTSNHVEVAAVERLGGNDGALAKAVPPSLIPQDPIKAVQAVESLRNGLREILKKVGTVTFLISWSSEDPTYLAFISELLGSACGDTPRQCWFTQPADKSDLDRPQIKGSGRRGITVHGPEANAIAVVLGRWFETYSTTRVPPDYASYKEAGTSTLIWIEIGPGEPWKQAPP